MPSSSVSFPGENLDHIGRTTTSADVVPSSLCTSPSRRVADIAGENLTLLGGICYQWRWIGIGVKVKALARLRAGDSDARGRRLPC